MKYCYQADNFIKRLWQKTVNRYDEFRQYFQQLNL